MNNMSVEKALEQLKIKVESEPNDISAWKTIVEILEIKLSNVEKENQELKEDLELANNVGCYTAEQLFDEIEKTQNLKRLLKEELENDK